MKRLPLLCTAAAVAALTASLAYWGLQLFKPAQRPIAAAALPAAPELNLEAAKGLFGGEIAVAVASNYQLKGVVAARGRDSAAILAVDGKPAVALAEGREVAPGVTVKEIHPKYVLLSENGATKRLDLPSDAAAGIGASPSMAPPLPPPSPGLQNTPPPPPPTAPQKMIGPQQTTSAPGFDRQ